MAQVKKFEAEVCDKCGQAITYRVGLSKGHVVLLKLFAAAIRAKGINLLHPAKELTTNKYAPRAFTVTEIKALSQVRLHGLLALSKDHPGNWLLTTKGAEFLRGRAVPRYALVLKRNNRTKEHNIGYWEPDENQITERELRREGEWWGGLDFTVVESRIVQEKDLPPVGAGSGKLI